jgi:hypothetical protein
MITDPQQLTLLYKLAAASNDGVSNVVLWNYSAIQEMENSSMKLKQD